RREVRFRYLQELEHVGIAEQVFRLLDVLPFCCQLKNSRFVFMGRKAEKQGGFLLTLKFTDRPAFGNRLLLIETAFQFILNLEKFDDMRPTQFVRHCRTNWVSLIKLPETAQIAAAEPLAVTQRQISTETA